MAIMVGSSTDASLKMKAKNAGFSRYYEYNIS